MKLSWDVTEGLSLRANLIRLRW